MSTANGPLRWPSVPRMASISPWRSGPTSVRSVISLMRDMIPPDDPDSVPSRLPHRERHTGAGAGHAPVAGDIVHQCHPDLLHGTCGSDPVEDLGCAGAEVAARDCTECLAIVGR